MKRLLLLVALASLPAHAQNFDCGKAHPGSTQLTATSIYKDATPGFDLKTAPEVMDGTCSNKAPFFFSIALPEGSYRVSVTLGGSQTSVTTIRAEARRLMIEKLETKPKASTTRTFDVNLRVPEIAGQADHRVKLKPREVGNLDWDNKLTLEFNGDHPSVRSIHIEPITEATIYLAGDSTVVDQDVEPWAAWGQMLPRFFGSGVAIANHAESGETIKSFYGEQRMAKILSLIQPGDYLFLQFGHNDQKPHAVALDEYKKLLIDAIAQTRAKGAIPVLVTSMNRRTFDAGGKIINSLSPYTEAVREIAASQATALIDLNAMSKTLFETMGPALSMKAFMHYPANAYPNQTEPISDDTHFNSYGAYELARCVVHGIREAKLPIRKYVIKGVADFDPSHPDPQGTFALPTTPIPSKTVDVMKVPQV